MTLTGKRIRKIIARIFICLVIFILLGWLSYQSWLNTAHAVIANKVYRSAQLSPEALKRVVETKHIKTIINLRGAHPKIQWYQEELAISKQMGIQHDDVSLSSYQRPSKTELRQLISLLQQAQEPILIHCLSGVDRSGFASAIALILDENASLQQSQRQFSLLYLATSQDSIGKLVFHDYERWLSTHHLEHSQSHFLEWAYLPNPFPTTPKTPQRPRPDKVD